MRNLGKNKKRKWRKLLPSFESDLFEAKKAGEIEDSSIAILNKQTGTSKQIVKGDKNSAKAFPELPSTTCRSRRIIRRKKRLRSQPQQADLWEKDSPSLTVSKKQRKLPPCRRLKKSNDGVNIGQPVLPHPGSSYNPAIGHHQHLLANIFQEEEKKDLQEKRLKRQLDDFFPSEIIDPMIELEQGLFSRPGEELAEVKEEDSDSGAPAAPTAKRRTARKPKVNKNPTAAAKRMAHDLNSIPRLLKEIKQTEKRQAERRRTREHRRTELHERKLPRIAEGFLLSEELTPTLRQLKADGSILRDQMTMRIKDPLARRMVRQKKWVKTFTRPG